MAENKPVITRVETRAVVAVRTAVIVMLVGAIAFAAGMLYGAAYMYALNAVNNMRVQEGGYIHDCAYSCAQQYGGDCGWLGFWCHLCTGLCKRYAQ